MKLRSANSQVEYRVGDVMRHHRYNYMCVVYGWDSVCAADEQWIVDMGIRSLSYGEYQPFYHVLVDDGSNRYAAQGRCTCLMTTDWMLCCLVFSDWLVHAVVYREPSCGQSAIYHQPPRDWTIL